MILPNLEHQHPRRGSIKKGVVLFSPVTEIYYKMVKGVLMKYPAYANAERGWSWSAYSMGFRHMKEATAKEIKTLK